MAVAHVRWAGYCVKQIETLLLRYCGKQILFGAVLSKLPQTEGPSTQRFGFLVPKTISLFAVGARSLKYLVLGPSRMGQRLQVPEKGAAQHDGNRVIQAMVKSLYR